MAVERQRAPTFYTVPAGTVKARCRSNQCQADIYFIDSLKTPGKKIPIDCGVVGGRAPTELESGTGIIHHIVCADAARFREKRPPARRPQREMEIDHKAPHCVFCGCTNDNRCRLTLEEAGLIFDEQPDGLDPDGYVGCSWVQMVPPVCNNPACLHKRKDLPLRMRVAGKR